jgi:ZIP family zinc transporter
MFSLAFLMTSLAGASTVIGSILIFTKKNRGDSLLISSLAFAAGVMICISLTDLIPESFNILSKYMAFLPLFCFVLIGINIGIISASFIENRANKYENNHLYKIGIISMLAIILHNIPEGIATYISCKSDINLGIKLTIAIALHNIPEGISISIPIYYATKKKGRALIYTIISGMSEILGAIIAYLFLDNLTNDIFMGFLYSIIAGIMLTISVKELLPTSLSYRNYKKTISYFIFGALFMLLSHLFLTT